MIDDSTKTYFLMMWALFWMFFVGVAFTNRNFRIALRRLRNRVRAWTSRLRARGYRAIGNGLMLAAKGLHSLADRIQQDAPPSFVSRWVRNSLFNVLYCYFALRVWLHWPLPAVILTVLFYGLCDELTFRWRERRRVSRIRKSLEADAQAAESEEM